MKFADIPAHEHIKSQLRNLVDGDKMPHALLLEGPPGIGKFALAQALAQYIHCHNRTTAGDSCGVCPACVRHQAMTDIDTHFVFPVVKRDKDTRPPVSDMFLEEWKDFLQQRIYMDFDEWTARFDKKNAQPIIYVTESESLLHKLSFSAHNSKYKIVLWWLPEKMNIEAANKLLKLIEEPFDDTLFILVSDSPKTIIETIYSRLQRVSVKHLDDNTIATELQRNFAIEPIDAMTIAHNANGNMTAAIRALDSRGDEADFLQAFIRLMRLAYQRKVAELREWANNIADWGREKEAKFYDYTIRLIRENFILNFNVPEINYLNRQESEFSVNFARFINYKNVEQLIDTFDKAKIDILGNGNGKIVNFDVAIRVILLLKQ